MSEEQRKRTRKNWTEEMKREFAEMWNDKKIPAEEIGEHFGLKTESVYKYHKKFGLPARHELIDKNPEKVGLIRKHYPHMSDETLGLVLGCSLQTVRLCARRLGLKKTEQTKHEMASYRIRKVWESRKRNKFCNE